MAGQKISQFTVISALASADYFPVIQNSDTSNKRIPVSQLFSSVPTGSASTPSLAFIGDTNTGIYSPGADQVAISTNGTGRLTVGTTAVSSTLAVDHPLGAVGTPSITFTGDLNTGFWSPSADAIAASTGGSERLRIDSSGRLGLGTSSPNHLLQVNGSACIAGTADNIFFGLDDNTSPRLGLVKKAGGGPFFGAGSSTSFVFSHSSGTDIATPSSQTYSERARIDTSGRLLVGTSTSLGGTGSIKLEVGNGNSLTSSFAANAFANSYQFVKSRSASALGTIVQNGDEVGNIDWFGDDGTSTPRQAARIQAFVDGTPGASDMPGRLVFSTTADGASSPTERMRIAQNGVVTIQNGAVAVIGTLTDGATITPDLAADCNFTVTLGGARTIANPTNITAGQSGSIFLVQDGTGGRTASWGSYWDFPGGTAPTLSTAANAVDRVDYIVRSSTSIHTVFTANYS
jgi:hypothetical protein